MSCILMVFLQNMYLQLLRVSPFIQFEMFIFELVPNAVYLPPFVVNVCSDI